MNITQAVSYYNIEEDLQIVLLFEIFVGVVRNQGGSNEIVPSTSRYRRLTYFAEEKVDENRIDLPIGDHLGAGGLDRGLFGHLQKNWTRSLTKSTLTTQAVVQEKRLVLFK